MLLSRLPDGAHTAPHWPGRGTSAGWERAEQLLAGAVDILADGFWRLEAMWVDEQKRRRKPAPIPRPGIEPEDRRAAFRARFAALRT